MSQENYFSTDITPDPSPQKKPDKKSSPTESHQLNAIRRFFERTQAYILKKWWLILLVVVALAFTFVSVFTYFALTGSISQAPSYTNVVASIQPPTSVAKGSPETWKITIENKESTSLSDITVNLSFDSNFEYIEPISPSPNTPQGTSYTIARLDEYQNGLYQSVISFRGTSKGNVDEDVVMSGTITYTADQLVRLKNAGKLNSSVSTQITKPISVVKTKTTAAQVTMIMGVKDEVIANNGEANLSLEIENLSEKDIRDLRIRFFYPQGFTYQESVLTQDNILSSKRTPDEGNNIWNVNTLPRLNSQKLNVTGTVFGAGGINLTFRADLEIKNGDSWESISTISRDITIAAKPLVLTTRIDTKSAFFKPGDTLTFIVTYENQGTNTVKDATITASVQDPANLLDWGTLQFEGGSRGALKNNIITWGGNNVSTLANLGVRVKGEFKYTITLKSESQFINTVRNQSEYVIVPQASADGKNIQPVQISGETYKARGDIIFTQKVTPLGAVEGQANKKRFRVLWELTTKQNAVDGVVIRTRSTLPTSSWIPSSITPLAKNPQIQYNPTNGEIIWNAGVIPSYSGISLQPVSISFDFEIENQVGGSNAKIELYKELTISGTDTFTGEVFNKVSPLLTVGFNDKQS